MSPTTPRLSFATLNDFVGKSIGTSSWIDVPQSRIDAFAECTEDRQWIHLDAERARRESPFGATVAHGFLTLSLIPVLSYELFAGLAAKKSVNYGLDKLRFIAPVRAGSRVRLHAKLLAVEPRADGFVLLRTENTVEIEDEDKPALVAVSLALLSAS
jgi:acyl dehydratase